MGPILVSNLRGLSYAEPRGKARLTMSLAWDDELRARNGVD